MKVYLDTVGCRLNQAEIEIMAREFRAAGHEIVGAAENAQLAVVNTCAVTAAAASDSRSLIRRLARGGQLDVIATGCWATLQPEHAAQLPGVSRVVGNDQKERLASLALGLPENTFDLEPLARVPLPGPRGRTRAFVKVQDGCENHCTFCVTTLARGASRSRSIDDVIHDVLSALAGGSREIVLTGVHLGSWGLDIGSRLKSLVEAILGRTDVPRLRLSSLEPWDLSPDFFSLWDDPRLCRHLHLPLQSGCGSTLKRMARRTTPSSFRQLVADARQRVPEVAITTDLIAGFPGETEAEFEASLEFVREMGFAGGHSFSYSARPGTAAARMRDQVAPEIRRRRTGAFRGELDAAATEYRQRMLGRRASILWESAHQISDGRWQVEGLTDTYQRVAAVAPGPRWNQMDTVELTQVSSEGLIGSIIKMG